MTWNEYVQQFQEKMKNNGSGDSVKENLEESKKAFEQSVQYFNQYVELREAVLLTIDIMESKTGLSRLYEAWAQDLFPEIFEEGEDE